MISSMTAFARQERQTPWGVLSWELRTVNHRFADISVRLPEDLRGLETRVRQQLLARVRRGKIDGQLKFHAIASAGAEPTLNMDLVRMLLEANNQIEALMENPARIRTADILTWPGVLQPLTADLSKLQREALELLSACLDELQESRLREGAKMKALIEQRCTAILAELEAVRARLPEILDGQRRRLHERITVLQAEFDTARLEQELVYLAQKIDVEEELDRIVVHVEEVRRVLEQDDPVGRRLDFLMQELNREVNTLGSKSISTITTRAAVEMKVLVEQMREQIQNIE